MTDKQTWYPGSCLCGAVRYEIDSGLKFIAHDHCSLCRRASGAAFVTWCGVQSEEKQFRLVSGAEHLTSYKSSPEAVRHFCKICGTPLFFRSSRWKGEIHVTFATLASQKDLHPKAHVFFSDRVPWITVNDDLPKYGGTTGLELLGSTPQK